MTDLPRFWRGCAILIIMAVLLALAILADVVFGATVHTAYAPVVASPCSATSPKRGVAPLDAFATATLVPYRRALCLPAGFPCFTWAAVPGQPQCAGGTTIPMVYANTRNLREHYGRDYNGLMLFANEPDLEGQASMTPTETAALACELQAYAPGVQLAGPAYSPLGWHHLPAFWKAYSGCNGGHDAVTAHVAHIYAVAGSPYPAAQLDAFYAALPAGQRHKPVYVHETGFHESAGHDAGRWLEELDGDGRVLSYGWFTPYPDEAGRFAHWRALVDGEGRLTTTGRAFARMER